MKEYAESRVFVQARSTLWCVADDQRQFAEECADVNVPDDSDGEKDQDGSDDIPSRFQSHSEVAIASQAYVGEVALSTLGDVFSGVRAFRIDGWPVRGVSRRKRCGS